MKIALRHFLMRIGDRLGPESMGAIKGVSRYLELGSLMREMGYPVSRVKQWVDHREDLFDLVAKEVGSKQVLYLEFGVWQGRATRYWSRLLTHSGSHLHGFDSFEGLPEDWQEMKQAFGKGSFSTGGAIPVIDDPRVEFFKGWFDQTLASYQVPPHEVLVLNLDADLYSSTKCVFDHIGPHIVPGTYLYFDEFNCPQDEQRAFRELVAASPYRFALRGSTRQLQQVLFQCV